MIYCSNLCTEIAQNMQEVESVSTEIKTKDGESIVVATTKPVRVEIDKKTYDVKSDLTAIGGNLQDV